MCRIRNYAKQSFSGLASGLGCIGLGRRDLRLRASDLGFRTSGLGLEIRV